MSDRYNERPDYQHYIEQAQQARAEAMARVGYLAASAVGRAVDAAVRPVQAAFAALAAWRSRRAAAHEILRLDDRLLRDIGLTRADAWAAVDGTLGTRAQDWPPPQPAAYHDIALTTYAAGACNDNGERRHAA